MESGIRNGERAGKSARRSRTIYRYDLNQILRIKTAFSGEVTYDWILVSASLLNIRADQEDGSISIRQTHTQSERKRETEKRNFPSGPFAIRLI